MIIILEMIKVIFNNTIGTIFNIISLFGDLTQSLSFIGGMGPIGFVIAVLVFVIVLYLLGRFILNSWKLIAILFVAGLIILWMLMAGGG
jgi:hypothetical protein